MEYATFLNEKGAKLISTPKNECNGTDDEKRKTTKQNRLKHSFVFSTFAL